MKTNFNTNTIEKKKVDAKNGEILGVTLMEGDREATGHNIFISELTLRSFVDAIKGEAVKLFYTHRNSEALEAIGVVNEVRIEENKLVGDLSLLNSFKENDRKRYDTLFELASDDEKANLIGISAEFINAPYVLDDDNEPVPFEGFAEGEEDKDIKVYAFATSVMAFSLVAEPASTDGLFEAKYDWNGGLIEEPAQEITELSSDEEIDEEEAVSLYAEKLEAQLETQSKEIQTLVALCKELQTEVLTVNDKNRELKTELESDAPFIEPYYEAEKTTLLDELNSINDGVERSNFIKKNINELWKLREVDKYIFSNK